MCRITNIDIKRYRGIGSLSVNELNQVNVLLGNNNSGKSSVLEAIMILLGAAKPTLAIEMNVNRNYSNIQKDDFLLFFFNTQSEKPIQIAANFKDEGSRDLSISYFETPVKKVSIVQEGEDGEDGECATFRYGYEQFNHLLSMEVEIR